MKAHTICKHSHHNLMPLGGWNYILNHQTMNCIWYYCTWYQLTVHVEMIIFRHQCWDPVIATNNNSSRLKFKGSISGIKNCTMIRVIVWFVYDLLDLQVFLLKWLVDALYIQWAACLLQILLVHVISIEL